MPRCASCSGEVSEAARFCPSCGNPLETATSAPTQTSAGEGTVSSTPTPDSRFIPGTILARRYRIIGLLGVGGMGEVYRADDLKLGQPVALKFLPQAVEQNQARLERFLNEVKTALKVSHPNVCRVHDIGEIEGQHYLSMEYVDGEDLASLLRRIGRLPEDKAVQLSRQLCAGLMAAHEQGILHRDLKPANVMIDGRGRAKITDFGLASLAEGIEGAEARVGTPAYMAPEQLAGKEVTVRSDIYALGLVLYELFTGKRAYEAKTPEEIARLQLESTPTSPSSHVSGLDPAVERVILHCLENDPEERPVSVMAVAAALPGGDPLAAALAAGETPSPDMVAAAGPQGGLRVWQAVACLALLLVGMFAMWIYLDAFSFTSAVPWAKSYEVLRGNAAELIKRLGYTEPPVDRTAAFSVNYSEFMNIIREDESWGGPEAISRPEQRILNLRYRQSTVRLLPRGYIQQVSANDPPPGPGDVTIHVNLQGELLSLRAIPPRIQDSHEPAPEADWASLLDAAGLDIESFEEAAPRVQPQLFADERAAWTGILPGEGERPVRIEAAACRGKPVYFNAIFPYHAEWPDREEEEPEQKGSKFEAAFGITLLTLLGSLLIGSILLTARSLALGRGDRRGALRIAIFIFTILFTRWLITGHHVLAVDEIYEVLKALSRALTFAVLSWLIYIALEPYVRRYWPGALVGWSRLLAGRLRDPLVGRHVLLGLSFAAGYNLLYCPLFLWGFKTGIFIPHPNEMTFGPLRGGRYALGAILSVPWMVLLFAAIYLLVFMLLRMVLRKQLLAAVGYCAIFGVFTGLNWTFLGQSGTSPVGAFAIGMAAALIGSVVAIFVLIRFGLLAFMAMVSFDHLFGAYPLTTDLSAPYFTSTLIAPIVLLAIGLYAFKVSLAGRPLFKES